MEASDVALAAILALVGALTSKALGVLAGVAAGAAYLLWKAGSWKPAEEIIQARISLCKHDTKWSNQENSV